MTAPGGPGGRVTRLAAGVPAPALVLVGIFTVQLGAAIATSLFAHVGSLGAVALRLAFAAAVLLVWWRPSLRLDRATWRAVLAYGLVMGSMNVCFYLSLDRLPLGVAVTVEFLGPLGVALAGSRRALDLVWVALAGAGVVLLADPRGALDRVGLALALGAGLLWGLYILASAALGRRTSGGGGLALGMAAAALVAVPLGVARAGTALLEPGILAAGLSVALLSSVIPYSVELEALRRIPPAVFGILMSLEPAVAALVGLLVLHEALRPAQWLAVACVVVASVGSTRGSRRGPAEENRTMPGTVG